MPVYRRWMVVAVIGGALALNGLSQESDPVKTNAAATTAATAFEPVLAQPHLWEGTASCSTSSCHGGAPKDPNNPLGAEFFFWFKGMDYLGPRRGHAYAYDLLLNDVSQQMGKLLGIKDPTKDDRCLNCHASNPKQDLRANKFAVTDGVGCESCHGPSEKWLTAHYLEDWKNKSAAEKATTGFANTKDIHTRVKVCTSCHVGSELNQDVYHDLIAAGHPRLNFEFGSYHANMERHWKVESDLQAYPDFEARAWEVGQLQVAGASLKLLAHRATKANAVWPEFSEYGCFACHHNLADPSWRQSKGHYSGRRPGALPWGTWYFALAPQVLDRWEQEGSALNGKLTEFQKLMSSPYPKPDEAAKQARDLAGQLEALASKAAHRQMSEPMVRDLLAKLTGDDSDRADASWDSATQFYLAVAALQAARQEMSVADTDLDQLIDQFVSSLQMPAGFNSPKGFDPEAVRKDVIKIKERIGK